MHATHPARLQVGQVLHRPLTLRDTGHVLLAAGTCLSSPIIDRIQRLGLTVAALQCVVPKGPRAAVTPIESTPDQAALLQDVAAGLHERLQVGPADPDSPGAQDWGPLATVRAIIDDLLERLAELPLEAIPPIPMTGLAELSRSINTALCAALIALEAQLPHEELLALTKAALLHDHGLRQLRRQFAPRNGELLPSEARLLEGHTEYGLGLLRERYAAFTRRQRPVFHAIRHMSERWDGSGRPFGLEGEQIPRVARILAVAGLYTSLILDRGNPAPLPAGTAYDAILDQSGKAFDPAIVEVFARVIRPYPVGTLLKLDTGKVAQVTRPGADPSHPIVQLGLGEGAIDLGRPGAPRIVKQFQPRRYPRRALAIAARLTAHGSAEQHGARTVDVSMGGARLQTSGRFHEGDRVVLTLEPEGREVMRLEAVVSWVMAGTVSPVTLGVRFLPTFSGATRRVLEDLTELTAQYPMTSA